MRMFTEVGRRVLPHSSGAGKAIMSMFPMELVQEVIKTNGLPKFTNTTITEESQFLRNLKMSRERGFAIDDEEYEVGVRCIAVSIPGTTPPAAISVSGPKARINDELIPKVRSLLQSAAKKLAQG